jgi:hypothetical protein
MALKYDVAIWRDPIDTEVYHFGYKMKTGTAVEYMGTVLTDPLRILIGDELHETIERWADTNGVAPYFIPAPLRASEGLPFLGEVK